MKKIHIMGKRAHRTPLSYPEYKKIAQRYFEYTPKPEDADFLVFSFKLDMLENMEEVNDLLSKRPDMRLVILSEEPLWDTVWGGEFLSKKSKVLLGDREHPVVVLNHFTTSIYDYESIPYFVTTSDDYFARYSYLFSRNRNLKGSDLTALWGKASLRAAFYAENRDNPQYDVHFSSLDVWGLSRYRTLVAKGMAGAGVARVGQGWGETVRRQQLPDWHLDKLAALDRGVFFASGLENTHQWNYVSEKIFDAFAVQGVPLYFASADHGVMRLVPPGSFVNLYGLNPDAAIERLKGFRPDKEFLDRYLEAQFMLHGVFSNSMNLARERRRIVGEIVAEFEVID
ncbi:glycosyltransferase family 10 [Desulfuromonas sp.]|uniref:glycosyltransferase family 10 domain-containing protein n=1 Tax=Desulfuromonas sp. TaxID=892 RepID=UPI0025BDFAA4|nr:glycosyltransferase family 10 [Desulfuromonas sp.]